MKKGPRYLALLLSVLTVCESVPVIAGPPFVTDDPEPVDFKHWEINLAAIYTHNAGVDNAQLASIDANYGGFEDVQLHFGAAFNYDREPDGGKAEFGYGDTELGIKYRFIHETDWLPQVSTYPLVELPSGDAGKGLGAGRTQVFAPLWLQKSFGAEKKWTAYGGAGFWYTPGPQLRNFVRAGAVLQREVTEKLALAAEIYHETPSARNPFVQPSTTGGSVAPHLSNNPLVNARGHTAFNLGGQYNFAEHYHLLFSAGRDLQGPNHFMIYLGIQLAF